jgi:hypothetical protein
MLVDAGEVEMRTKVAVGLLCFVNNTGTVVGEGPNC